MRSTDWRASTRMRVRGFKVPANVQKKEARPGSFSWALRRWYCFHRLDLQSQLHTSLVFWDSRRVFSFSVRIICWVLWSLLWKWTVKSCLLSCRYRLASRTCKLSAESIRYSFRSFTKLLRMSLFLMGIGKQSRIIFSSHTKFDFSPFDWLLSIRVCL